MKKSLTIAVALCAISTGVWASDVPDAYGGNIKSAPTSDDQITQRDIVEPASRTEAAAPIRLTADKVEYNEETGDFYAKGNVVVSQNGQTLKTTYAEGNMKNGQVFLKNGGEFIEGGVDMHAEWIYYNFLDKSGQIQKIYGRNYTKQEWYSAPDAVVRNGNIYAEHGAVMSSCPARQHAPCLSVEAKFFEIIPHKKMIAKDCWVKVRGGRLYHRARWEKDLTKKSESKLMPRLGYDSDSGVSLGVDLETPLWYNATLSGEGRYYSHDDWKHWLQVTQDTKNFRFVLGDGWKEDDGDWYRKEANWQVNLKRHRLIKGLPFTYSAFLEHGLWKRWYRSRNKYSGRSRHTEYGAYLYCDPIHFFHSRKNSLNLYIGKKWVREELTDLRSDTNMYGATFTQDFGKHVKFWVGYYDQKYEDNRLFDIGQADMSKELRPGLQITTGNGRDVFRAVYRLNTQNGYYNGYNYGHRYEFDLTWTHHFCCWDLEVAYERRYAHQDNRWRISYNFNFM